LNNEPRLSGERLIKLEAAKGFLQRYVDFKMEIPSVEFCSQEVHPKKVECLDWLKIVRMLSHQVVRDEQNHVHRCGYSIGRQFTYVVNLHHCVSFIGMLFDAMNAYIGSFSMDKLPLHNIPLPAVNRA
jgi:hypothetical protein